MEDKELTKNITRILNKGRSGDLDASGCAEYNPELVPMIKQLTQIAIDKAVVAKIIDLMLHPKHNPFDGGTPEGEAWKQGVTAGQEAYRLYVDQLTKENRSNE